MLGDLLRQLRGSRADKAHPGNPDHEQRPRADLRDFSKPYTGPPPRFTPDPSGFWMEVEPSYPYRPLLHAPGDVTKLLSYEEAWKMLWEQQFKLLARQSAILF